jgi:hypothetical protein
MDDALGRGRDHGQADLLERVGRRVEHLPQLGRDVAALDLLLAGGGDDVAGGERLHPEASLQRQSRAVQPQILLRRGKHDLLRRFRFGLADGDELARSDSGIGALKAVEADDVEPLILWIRPDRARRSRPLARDLDHVAFGKRKGRHRLTRQPGEAAATILGPHRRHLQPDRLNFRVRHLCSC